MFCSYTRFRYQVCVYRTIGPLVLSKVSHLELCGFLLIHGPHQKVKQYLFLSTSLRKHLGTKVTPDLHLAYSKNGGNLGLILK